MATNARSSADREFVIGNRAQELFVAVIGICDPRKDKSHFPAYCRDETGGEMIRAAREILRGCLFANGCRDEKRTEYQRDAYNNIVYLNFLTRTAYDNKWINEKQHDRILRYTGKVVKRLTKSKRKTQRNRCRLIARQLGEGKIAPERAAESYRSWREHAMQGDCRKLVLSMDERFRRHLKTAGFELKIESYRKNNKIKERVTICREHSAS